MRTMTHEEAYNLVRCTVGTTIRSIREARGLSQAGFAEMVDINRSYLNQIESGKMNASIRILVKIADGLDVPITDLFEGLEGNPPHALPKDVTYYAVKSPASKR